MSGKRRCQESLYRRAKYGNRLNQKAPTCNTANATKQAAAVPALVVVLARMALHRPVTAATPTTSVMAISVGENRPETIRAHPSRNSQMKTMIVNQNNRHGRAAHLAI